MKLKFHNTNIGIRKPTFADRDQFIKAMRLSENFHHPWVTPPKNDESFNDYIKKYNLDNNISYLVLSNSEIAGVININEIVRGCFQSGFLGYYAVSEFSGAGIMKIGMLLVMEAAFREHGLHRLEANIQPDNHPSINLIKQCDFIKEGYSYNYLKIDNEWKDHERWAITKEIANEAFCSGTCAVTQSD